MWSKGIVKRTNIAPPKVDSTSTKNPVPVTSLKVVKAQDAEVDLGCTFAGETAFTLAGPVKCTTNVWRLVDRESDSIESRAYRFVVEHWNKQPEGNLSVAFYIDPKSGAWTKSIENGLRVGARFWGTSEPGSRSVPAFISDNYLFIEAAMVKAGIPQSDEDKARNKNARGGQAGWHQDSDESKSYWDFLYFSEDSRRNVGFYQVGPHEYTHFAQSKLAKNMTGDEAHLPWVNEGLASYFGSALGPMSDMPRNQMDSWREMLRNTFSPLSFFGKASPEVYRSSTWSDVYPMGAVASEALVALFGVDGIVTYYTDLASGMGNEKSFKKNFQLGRVALTALMEEYLESVKKRENWNLQMLEKKFKEAVVSNS